MMAAAIASISQENGSTYWIEKKLLPSQDLQSLAISLAEAGEAT